MSSFLGSLSRLRAKRLYSLCVFPKSTSTMTAVARRIHGKRLIGPSGGSSESSLRLLNTPRRLLVQPEQKNPPFASFSSTTSKKLASETMAEKKIQPEGMIEQIKYNPHLKSRFNQSLFNWVFSFSAMILAAQSLKSSKERQKVQRKLEESEEISQERLQVLQSLVESKTLEPITQRILVELQKDQMVAKSKERSGWFGSSAKHGVKDDDDDKGLSEKVVSKILLEEMFRLVGEKALDEAQREVFMAKNNLTTGDGENDVVKNVDPEKLMVGGAAENPAPTTGPAEKRKKAFTM